ncbi:MAG: PDZ domain-containing protein, partial [Sciscionella sp.]|nr:PDZ domain-containing protein [Sciscionella sp.]
AGAKIAVGDVITNFGGRLITSAPDLQAAVLAHNIGDVVDVRLTRGGAPVTVKVTLKSD